MADGTPHLSLEVYPKIAEIGQAAWEDCAGCGNPFISYGFLSALEDSGSVGRRTGWHPRYAVLRNSGGTILAIAPSYAKTNSYGEYVFDHGWARLMNGQAAPITQAPGRRAVLAGAGAAPSLPPGLAARGDGGSTRTTGRRRSKCSSVHVTFCTKAESDALGAAGWLQRLGTQFHWENNNYRSFDDFLGALSSRKRKVIKRERRDAQEGG